MTFNKTYWRRSLRVTLLAGLCLSAGMVAAQTNRIVPWATPAYTYTLHSDVTYGQGEINGGGSFKDLKLDLYIPDVIPPEGAQNQFPLMLMLHGGGGDKAQPHLVSYAEQYVQRGWLVASINFRLSEDDPIPSTRVQALYDHMKSPWEVFNIQFRFSVSRIDDTLTALDFLQSRADVYSPWTTFFGLSAGAYTSLATAYALDDHGIERPPVAAVLDNWGWLGNTAIGNPFDDPTGSDPVLMITHGTADEIIPFSSATDLESWALASGLTLDFQPIAGGEHALDLFNNIASTGVTLFQRSVDYQHETIFAGLEQGPQPPSGC